MRKLSSGFELPRPLVVLVVLSLVAHVLLVLAATAFNPEPELEYKYVETQLVRLGVEKAPDLLPNKVDDTAPPPPEEAAAEEAEVVPDTPAPEKPPEVIHDRSAKPEKKKVPAKKAASTSSVLDRLKRSTKAQAQREGHADGVASGGSASGTAAALYSSKIVACLQNGFRVQGMTPTLADRKLVTKVATKVGKNGKLYAYRITKSSGNPLVDQGVKRALKACESSLPPPPASEAALFGKGIFFNFFPFK